MSVLFTPLQLGAVTIPNRIVMSPLTRRRAGQGRVPTELMAQYYSQRAGAGLIISEATSISPQGVGYLDTPGIWSTDQTAGWKQVTGAVHREGGRIFLQLWHVGRISDPDLLDGALPVAPSAVPAAGRVRGLRPLRTYSTPRPLTLDEIPGVVADFKRGALNAKEAGFDGVDIHAANGYLIDQFLQDSTNRRADNYGGAIENRARFLMEITDAVSEVWGPERVGVHLRPRGEEHDMGDSNPPALFTYVAEQLRQRRVGFLFVRETEGPDSLLRQIRRTFRGPVIANDEMSAADGRRLLESGAADAIAFGRDYIATPDLAQRVSSGLPLNEPDASTFYAAPGSDPAVGYVDYPALVH